ncbi:hypothetical protein TURU_116248 [Turdus rufiventris]|nr:hypothetical protein TURU_116248 [Turdus rufiventris]
MADSIAVVEAKEQPCQKVPEVLVNSKLDRNQPHSLATKTARSILVCMDNSAARTSREVIIPSAQHQNVGQEIPDILNYLKCYDPVYAYLYMIQEADMFPEVRFLKKDTEFPF